MSDRIPILKLRGFLLVTIQVDIHDELVSSLQDDLTNAITTYGATGVIIDISALEIVDSFIARMLGDTAAMSLLLGAQTIVAGMRPAVAITLVELGIGLKGVLTALSVDRGMELLEALTANSEEAGEDEPPRD